MKKRLKKSASYITKNIEQVNKKDVRRAIKNAERENETVDQSTKIDYHRLSVRAGS